MSVLLEVFCCYAREDQEMLVHLKKHLMPLQRSGQITIWSDTNLNAGVEWEKELHQHLESADLILLLISPDFMASDYCYSTEMGRAIDRHRQGSAQVVPILLRPVHWDSAPFAWLQMIPTNAVPVTKWSDSDDAFHDITGHIKRFILEFQSLQKSQRFRAEADTHFNAEHYQDALVSYEQALHLHPTNGQALFGRAKTLYQLGKIDASIEAFALAKRTALGVGDIVSALFQADALKQREQYAESLIAYNWALDLNSGTDPDVYNAKSDVLYKLKCYEEAVSVCEQAIRLDPNNTAAYHHKGNALEALRRYEEALSAYDQAIRLDPNNATAHYNKGDVLLGLGRYEEATSAYDQAVYLKSDFADAYAQKGVSLISLHRYEEAFSAWDQASSHGPVHLVSALKTLKEAVLKRLNEQSGEQDNH